MKKLLISTMLAAAVLTAYCCCLFAADTYTTKYGMRLPDLGIEDEETPWGAKYNNNFVLMDAAMAAVAASTETNTSDIVALKVSTGNIAAALLVSTTALEAAKVNRAGDTITGDLTINKNAPFLYLNASSGQSQIRIRSVLATNPILNLSAPNDGVRVESQSDHALIFGVNSVEKMRIANDGKIGISSAAPAAAMGVEGGIIATSSITALSGVYGGDSQLNSLNIVDGANGINIYASGVQQGNISIGSSQANYSGTSGARLSSGSGYVYINGTNAKVGVNSFAPTHALDVTGGIVASSSITAQGGFYGNGGGNVTLSSFTTTGDAAIGGKLAVNMTADGTHALDVGGAIHTTAQAIIGGSVTVQGGLGITSVGPVVSTSGFTGAASLNVLKTGDVMTGPLQTSSLTVTGNSFTVGGSTLVVSAGRVGIGNTNPQHPLEVNGNGVFSGQIISSGTGTNYFAGNTKQNSGGYTSTLNAANSGYTYCGGDATNNGACIAMFGRTHANSGATIISYGNSASSIETARFTGTGSVGIGNTNPDTKLHISSGSLIVDGANDYAANLIRTKTDFGGSPQEALIVSGWQTGFSWGNGNGPSIMFKGRGNAGGAYNEMSSIASRRDGADNASSLSILNPNGGASGEVLRIKPDGNVVFGSGNETVSFEGWTYKASRGIYARNATTGSISSGTVVTYAAQYNNTYGDIGVSTAAANSQSPIGTVFNTAGCAAGAICKICTEGLCPARLDSGSACANTNDTVLTGTEVGRAVCASGPAAATTHWQEIGQPAIFTAQNGHVIWIFAHRN